MPRTTKNITFTPPPAMADRVEWPQLLRYGEETAKTQGIGPEDVAALVEEYRTEADRSPA